MQAVLCNADIKVPGLHMAQASTPLLMLLYVPAKHGMQVLLDVGAVALLKKPF
jgi:hypothetical protein